MKRKETRALKRHLPTEVIDDEHKQPFPESYSTYPTPRMPTLNVTHSNIESHHKTQVNSARNTIQNHKQRSEHKLKTPALTARIFFQTHTNPTHLPLNQTSKV
jgi:hypothetical protein